MHSRIKSQLTELLDVVSSVDSLVNSHVSHFFTSDLWSTILPKNMIKELESYVTFSDFMDAYSSFASNGSSTSLNSCPHLLSYLKMAQKHSLLENKSNTAKLSSIENIFNASNVKIDVPPLINDFMTEKKRHEIRSIVPLADAISKYKETSHIVDIGGGKGYLGYSLAMKLDVHVVNVDASSINTCGANKMTKKLSKKYKRQGNNYLETAIITRKTDLSQLIEEKTRIAGPHIGIIGLHTCGDLATTNLHLFFDPDVKWLVNVGCCYHLITEEFETFPDSDDCASKDFGFPASEFLREKKFHLGRNARMLAAHSFHRIIHEGFSDKSSESLFYRALFQILIERTRGHKLVDGRVGRLAGKCDNFVQYIRQGIQKLKLNICISDDEINELLGSHAPEKIKLQQYFLIRTHFATVIESIILLDRLLFLCEQGVENVFLVPLFDPVISPRNHAIVAWKK